MVVKINAHGNKIPEQYGEWIDLSTAEDVMMKRGDFRLISLGVSVKVPEGYYSKLLPRSSTPGRHGIVMANGVGIIDHDYCGDDDIWKFAAIAIRDTFIPKGSRIAQFCVVKQEEEIDIEIVESLGNMNRGGFGSTGI